MTPRSLPRTTPRTNPKARRPFYGRPPTPLIPPSPSPCTAEVRALKDEFRQLRRDLARGRPLGISDPGRLIEVALTRMVVDRRSGRPSSLLSLPLAALGDFCRDLLRPGSGGPGTSITDAHRRLRERCPEADSSRAAFRFAEQFREQIHGLVTADPAAEAANQAWRERQAPTIRPRAKGPHVR